MAKQTESENPLENKTEAEKQPTNPPPKPPPKKEAAFTLAQLASFSQSLFGVTTSTFDGAFFGRDGTYTIKEAEQIIKDWLGKPIRTHSNKGGE